jgi:hypothetical protein
LAARLWRDHKALADEAYRRGYDFGLEAYGAPVSFVAGAMIAFEAAEELRRRGFDRGLRHVTTIGYVDEFTPLLGLEPAPGLPIVLDPTRSVGRLTQEEAAAHLAPVDAAFERTCAAPSWLVQLTENLRPALVEAFEPVVLTPCWTVHLRRA